MRMASDAVWRQEDESLVRDYEFKDFVAAMAFVNRSPTPPRRPTTTRTSSSTAGTRCV